MIVMNRLFASTSAVVLLVGLLAPADAEMSGEDPYVMGPLGVGGYAYDSEPYGGFGLEFAQLAPAGSLMMDRFGMWYALPYISPAPTVAASQPRANLRRAGSRRTTALPRYSLPTGSLYWPGASEVILYSPSMRYRAYGGGYARDPYGSIDHSIMYKGWPLR
jgi:hypothetical protein